MPRCHGAPAEQKWRACGTVSWGVVLTGKSLWPVAVVFVACLATVWPAAAETAGASDQEKVEQLVGAVFDRNSGAVERLLAEHANVNGLTSDGKTALMAAVLTGQLDAVKILIAAGADVNVAAPPPGVTIPIFPRQQNTSSSTPASQPLPAIERILPRSTPLPPSYGETALYWACVAGNVEIVKALLAAGANVNLQDSWKRTPLVTALLGRHIEAADVLFAAGADVKPADVWGLTALMEAADKDARDLIIAFIAKGADVNAHTEEHSTALIYTAWDDYVESAKLLLAAGADPNLKRDDGTDALMTAAETGRTEMAAALIAGHADVNAARNDGATALMLAAQNGRNDVVRLLVAAKADVNAKTPQGVTALSAAEQNGHADTVALLKAEGAK